MKSNRFKRIMYVILLFIIFMAGIIIKAPAWLVGSLLSKYSQNHLVTRNENGTFWNGGALLVASDGTDKKYVPLIHIDWKIKLGLSKFVTINFDSYGQNVAVVVLDKTGLNISNVNFSLAMEQLEAFAGNLGTLNLSGNVNVTADKLSLGKKNSGTIDVSLNGIGSGMSPVNPIGSYKLSFDLSNQALNVSTAGDSVINVTGDGNLTGLSLHARVNEDKKEQMLQFMTMMGLPQSDGSYLLKVF